MDARLGARGSVHGAALRWQIQLQCPFLMLARLLRIVLSEATSRGC